MSGNTIGRLCAKKVGTSKQCKFSFQVSLPTTLRTKIHSWFFSSKFAFVEIIGRSRQFYLQDSTKWKHYFYQYRTCGWRSNPLFCIWVLIRCSIPSTTYSFHLFLFVYLFAILALPGDERANARCCDTEVRKFYPKSAETDHRSSLVYWLIYSSMLTEVKSKGKILHFHAARQY